MSGPGASENMMISIVYARLRSAVDMPLSQFDFGGRNLDGCTIDFIRFFEVFGGQTQRARQLKNEEPRKCGALYAYA
jgi:hypothetical protein